MDTRPHAATEGDSTAPPSYELRGFEVACPECGYDLRGLVNITGARCPECGQRSPFDELRFPVPRRWHDDVIAIIWMLVPPAVIAGGRAAWSVMAPLSPMWHRVVAAAAGVVIVFALLTIFLWPHGRWWKRLVVAFVVGLLLVFGGWRGCAAVLLLVVTLTAIRWRRWWQQRLATIGRRSPRLAGLQQHRWFQAVKTACGGTGTRPAGGRLAIPTILSRISQLCR